MRRPRSYLAGAAAVVTIGALVPLTGPGGVQAAAPAAHEAGSAGRTTVTLITGDRVRYVPARGGTQGQVLDVQPGPGRDRIPFRIMRLGRQQLVLPLDAAGLVAAGKVDRRLFDVGLLAESRLDDKNAPKLPLLLERSRRAAKTLTAGTEVARDLPVIDAVAVRAERRTTGQLWKRWTADGRLAAGLERIRLDGGVKVSLDRSVPQIGAPEAWKAGATGKGVKVAVLDTGYDATHPDLAKVAGGKDFTEDGDLVDRNGHGTHVISTIMGSGAASGGRYKGVAPDAGLIVGKVCDRWGQCTESSIIAGMQWAAAQGARVVSMSLGGQPTDGTDPMSQAVNELTRSTGALFVIAAGNDGADQTVGTPASADAALAVASVTKADTLSPFSSRGPRYGDLALKPDISAPGSRIVAARAAGTLPQFAVDEHYAELSGTSMATPHIAGAAAIVAQLHPSWKAEQLRSALTGSAHGLKDLDVFAQGAGRVDVARAIHQQVTSTEAVLNLGTAAYPHDDDEPLTKTVAYRNDGDRPVTLRLRTQLEGPDGPSRLVRLARTTLTVPAHGTASTTVSADTRGNAADGAYGGWIIAEGNGQSVRTTVGLNREVPSFDLTVDMVNRKGEPATDDFDAGTTAIAIATDTATGFGMWTQVVDGKATMRLTRGTYVLEGLQGLSAVPGDGYTEVAYNAEPSQRLDRDSEVMLDARRTRQVRTAAPAAGLTLASASVGFARPVAGRTLVTGMAVISGLRPDAPAVTLYVAQNKTGTEREFTGFGHAVWAVRPPDQKPDREFYMNSPSVYNDVARWPGRFPADPALATAKRDYARVDVTYPAAAPGTLGNRYVIPVLGTSAGQEFGGALWVPNLELSMPRSRPEYVAASPGIRWTHELDTYHYIDESTGEVAGDGIVWGPTVTYRPGRTYAERWGGAAFGPGLHSSQVGAPWFRSSVPWVYRDGDSVTVSAPMFSDSGAGRAGDSSIESELTTVDRDGVRIASSEAPVQQTFALPAGKATYTLTKQITRPADRFPLSPRVTAAWTFRSARTADGSAVALPLLSVRYEPRLDDRDRAPAGRFSLPVSVVGQDGSGAGPARTVAVEASYDEGLTWHRAPVRRGGDGWTATLEHPAGGLVSLRTTARDGAGNQVVLTTIRAYGIGS